MTFWVRSALTFVGAGWAVSLCIPFAAKLAFSFMVSPPPGPEPELVPFQPVAQDLRAPSEIPAEPDGTFRVDYRAEVPAGGDGKSISKTIDTIASDHCLLLIKAFARSCHLETMQSAVNANSEDATSRPTEIFMRFRVTQRLD